MITYQHGDTFLHGLDPRSKLLVQFGFAAAVLGSTAGWWLGSMTALALLGLGLARLSPLRVLWTYRFVFVILGFAPLLASVTVAPLGLDPSRAVDPVLAGYQVLLVLLVSSAYVRTTPVRGTRAALQRHVPGRPGQLLGVGVARVFRFFPLLLADLRRSRHALRARGGDARGLVERTWRLALLGLQRAFGRADTLALALRARCFAWNPTLPVLRFSGPDYLAVLVGVALAVSPLFV